MRALVIAVVLVSSSVAAADKSESTAFRLSAVGTAVSSTAILASFFVDNLGSPHRPTLYAGLATSLVTPSLGQYYAGQFFSIGTGVRVISAAIAAYGASRRQDQPCDIDPMENCPTITPNGLTIISLAAIAYIGGVAYDVRDAPHAAARANKRRRGVGATLAPTRNGIALVGQF